ncbi:MAG: hypothetical protein KDD14_25370 [Saprospiraceae bacterium]|nr:hypothetical protein [Saprospiraceae bacterium]
MLVRILAATVSCSMMPESHGFNRSLRTLSSDHFECSFGLAPFSLFGLRGQRAVRSALSVAPRHDVCHRPVGPAYEDLRRRLTSISFIFKAGDAESTGIDVARPEPSHTGPTGRKPIIQTDCYLQGGPNGPRRRFQVSDTSEVSDSWLRDAKSCGNFPFLCRLVP